MHAPASLSHAQISASRYLTLRLDHETYGVRVLDVQEIIRLPAIARVPRLPACVRGVLNLRGRIIPVIDLGRRFGLPASVDHDRTCVVVVQVQSASRGTLQMGLVVDAVEEVLQIAGTEISEPPEFGCQMDTAFLLGLAKVKGAVIALLDLDRVLTGEQLETLAAATIAVA
jgi:purine-binding chemotaxis protein CheW